jgi:hypothetical protein
MRVFALLASVFGVLECSLASAREDGATRAELKRHHTRLQRCADRPDARPSGKMQVEMVIGSRGQVRSAALQGTLASREADACVLGEFSRMSFPRSRRRTITVSLVFVGGDS